MIHATALIVSEYSHDACHWNLTSTLGDWLKQHKVKTRSLAPLPAPLPALSPFLAPSPLPAPAP